MTAIADGSKPLRSILSPAPYLRAGIVYLGLVLVDAFALFLVYALAADGVWELAITIALVTVAVNIINLRQGLYALRWIAPALALMCLLVVFPLVYTVYVAFTKYGDGNLLTKQQVINLLASDTYLPEGGKVYAWNLYQDESGEYALWLTDNDDGDRYYFAPRGGFEAVTSVTPGADLPATYQGYRLMDRGEALRASAEAQALTFGTGDNPIGIAGRRDAGEFAQRYVYQPEQDAVLDQELGQLFKADYDAGQFMNADGDSLRTGFITGAGLKNFQKFLDRDDIRGPLVRIFIWTVGFALASVFTTFSLGLFFALIMQNERIPLRKAFRTVLIVPFAMPGLISIAIWVGMLNPNFGVISNLLRSVGLEPPPFFIDPGWSKAGIILINLWLGYPYFLLVCSGALAAIPTDMYEAAEVDGANWWQKFHGLTLPMLLIAVGPLLIASFTYNFNNFVLIEAFNEGGPPMVEAGTLPAGHTDNLISYAFRLAFQGGRGADYGLASAITIIIFLMVAAVTLLQFRLTKGWEEVSENV